MRKPIKVLALMLALLMLASVLPACVSVEKGGSGKEDGRLYVVCTVFPQYDFIKNIAGDLVRLEMLVPAGTDTHNFTMSNLSVSKINELKDADLIVFVGGESDEALQNELQKAFKDEDITFLTLLSLIDQPLCNAETDGMHVEEGSGEEHEEEHDHDHDHEQALDEHVWTSPKRAMELTKDLCKLLCELDPAGQKTYEANAERYIGKLSALDASFEELKENRTFDTLIFADRFPFRYLCYDYGISADAAFTGCSTSVDPSVSTMDYLYQKAERLGLPAILYMEGSTPVYAETLAERIGGVALLLHSCHIPNEKEFKSESYLSLMEKNLDVLKTALGAE